MSPPREIKFVQAVDQSKLAADAGMRCDVDPVEFGNPPSSARNS